MAEYGLLLALVVVVTIGCIVVMGGHLDTIFGGTAEEIDKSHAGHPLSQVP